MLDLKDIKDIEESIIQAVIGVSTGAMSGIIIVLFLRMESTVHPLYKFVLGTVSVTVVVLLAFVTILGCKYIIRRL